MRSLTPSLIVTRPSRSLLRPVVLALLLVLAGYAGFAGDAGDAGSAGGDATADGVDATAGSGDAGDAAFPPGVNATGVENPPALALAHEQALNATSFTFEQDHADRYEDGTVRPLSHDGTVPARSHFVGRYAADGERYHLVYTNFETGESAAVATYETWSNGERVFSAAVRENGTATVLPARDEKGEPLTPAAGYRNRLPADYVLFLLNAVRVDSVERLDRTAPDGTPLFRLTASEFANPGEFATGERVGVETIDDLTFEAVVDANGLVREYRYAFSAADQQGRALRISETGTVTAVGRTTVDPPSWADERERAGQ